MNPAFQEVQAAKLLLGVSCFGGFLGILGLAVLVFLFRLTGTKRPTKIGDV